jgi:hypothetical protein
LWDDVVSNKSGVMDKKAIEAAYVSLAKAEASLQSMQAAKEYSEFQAAWSDLLVAAGRIYSKLQHGAKGKSSEWFGHRIRERKNDAILAYIHHARNADEHGIKPIIQHSPGSVSIQSTGSTHIKQFGMWPDGTIGINAVGSPLKVTVVPNSADLIPVTDRGVTYDPPKQHQGSPIQDQSPAGIGKLVVGHLRTIIADAEKLGL